MNTEASPSGISRPAMVIFGGTFQPRSPLYLKRSTSMDKLLNVKLQITPNAYASPKFVDIAAAEQDGAELQKHHHVDDAVAGAETFVGLAEPVGQYTVFGNAVEHAVRADDGGVDRSGENQEADHHDKSAE